METLRWFLEGLLDLFQGYLELWVRGVGAVASEFQLNLTPAVAGLIGIVLGVLSIFGVLNAVLKWDRKGNQPQAFPLKTEKTPDQVVAADRQNLLMLLLKVTLFMLFLAVLISVRA